MEQKHKVQNKKQNSYQKLSLEDFCAKHGGKVVQKTGHIIIPLSKGQRQAIERMSNRNLNDKADEFLPG